MEDGLHVDKFAFGEIDIDVRPQKFLGKEGNINPAKSQPSICAASDLAISLKVGQSLTSSSLIP